MLDVRLYPLVGVEFGRVAGQEEQLQAAVGGGHEFGGDLGPVCRVTVDDEVDRTTGVVPE